MSTRDLYAQLHWIIATLIPAANKRVHHCTVTRKPKARHFGTDHPTAGNPAFSHRVLVKTGWAMLTVPLSRVAPFSRVGIEIDSLSSWKLDCAGRRFFIPTP